MRNALMQISLELPYEHKTISASKAGYIKLTTLDYKKKKLTHVNVLELFSIYMEIVWWACILSQNSYVSNVFSSCGKTMYTIGL